MVETIKVSVDLDDEIAQFGVHNCFETRRCQLTAWEVKLVRWLTLCLRPKVARFVRSFNWLALQRKKKKMTE